MNQSPNSPLADQWLVRLQQALGEIQTGKAGFVELLKPTLVSGSPRAESHPKILLPGSFNPLHRGHVGMAGLAQQLCGRPVWFEMSFHNADKPESTASEVASRLLPALTGGSPGSPPENHPTFRPHGLLLTDKPTYLEKARLFPNTVFAVGIDTIIRVAEQRFYDHSIKLRDQAIAELTELGCRFLIFGRSVNQRFATLPDMDLPASLLAICETVTEPEFRVDISSTQLRKRNPE